MYEVLMHIMENALNIIGRVAISVILFQFGIKRVWPNYPLYTRKKGFYLFVALLGVYGFVRSLITGC